MMHIFLHYVNKLYITTKKGISDLLQSINRSVSHIYTVFNLTVC
jgi:hypothetical protein